MAIGLVRVWTVSVVLRAFRSAPFALRYDGASKVVEAETKASNSRPDGRNTCGWEQDSEDHPVCDLGLRAVWCDIKSLIMVISLSMFIRIDILSCGNSQPVN